MDELKSLKAQKPTIAWRTSLPLFTRILLFKGFSEVDRTLNDFISKLQRLNGDTSEEKIMEIVKQTITQLNKIDAKRQIIETSERDDLCEFIGKAARMAGLKIEPKRDITEGYRNW